MTEPEVQFKSFSKPRPKIEFDCGPDAEVFEAYPVMPPAGLQEMISIVRQVRSISTDDAERSNRALKILDDFFELVLVDESIDRFKKKMQDKKSGVQLDDIMDIFHWLIERYGLRPTESPSPSSTGSPSGDGGTSSTGGAQLAESVPSS